MVGPVHTSDALAEFQNGETRMVFARYRDAAPDAPSYFLEDGTARDKDLKAWVPGHLECLMPECPDRRLRAVNRSEHSGRRDGFSHRSGAGKHSPEGLFHQQGKALIQSWVSRAYPDVEVALEVATATRERIADVMVTWPTGQRMAVEIQYAPLTVEAWLTRHQSYLSQGIMPVWVLGHHGAHMKTARAPVYPDWKTSAGQAQLSRLQQKMTEHDAMVLWINPVDRTIATPWTVERVAGQPDIYEVFCRSETDRAFLTVDDLDQCSLDPVHGLLTPTMRALVESEERYRQRLAEIAAAAAAAEARRQAERAKAAQEQEARRLCAQQKAAEDALAWEAHPLHKYLLKRLGGRLPYFLDCELAYDRAIHAHPAHWHSQLFYDLVLGPGRTPMTGRTVSMRQVYAMIGQHFRMPDPHRRSAAIADYLHYLSANDILNLKTAPDGTIGTITVVSDGLTPRATPSPTASSPSPPAPSGEREQRWEDAMIRRALMGLFQGAIPEFLHEDPTPDTSAAIDALPVHWHAHLYLKYIHDRGRGYTFTLRDACNTLTQHRLAAAATEPVRQAVAAYLRHLSERHRLLTAPECNFVDGAYYLG